jgi:hypothetical protein
MPGTRFLNPKKRNVMRRNKFNAKFLDQYRTVRDYYVLRKELVVIQEDRGDATDRREILAAGRGRVRRSLPSQFLPA